MPQSLAEYAEWLAGRKLIWPAAPPAVSVKATPYIRPLTGIRAVTWSVYGTLLRITDGELLHTHPQQLRMQVALEKTIQEFNMWNSMTRKPGAPWEYMLHQYQEIFSDLQMAATRQKGDVPEINSSELWRKILDRLGKKEYQYDESQYGDLDELAEKVAYFFHASLQGVEATAGAREALTSVMQAGLTQGLMAEAQPFTLVQLLRAFSGSAKLAPLGELFTPGCLVLSFQVGVRPPSKSLYRAAVRRFESAGIAPREVLHIGCRVQDDLAAAREMGFRTALFAGDGASLKATKAELLDPALKPDRLLTDLRQLRDVLSL